MTKYIISIVTLISIFFTAYTAYAADVSLFVSPADGERKAGESFEFSVFVGSSEKPVYVAEGKLVFGNLSCGSITVVSGLMAQSSPTCENPYFLVGIPGGSTTTKRILDVKVSGGSAGMASVSLTGVDIVGEGVSLGKGSAGGNYTLKALQAVPKTTSPAVQKPSVASPATRTPQISGGESGIATTSATSSLAAASAGGERKISAKTLWIIFGILVYALSVYGAYILGGRKKGI